METNGLDPISAWKIDQEFTYFVLVFGASLGLRVLACLLKAIHTDGFTKAVWKEFWIQLKGHRLVLVEHAKGDVGHKRADHILKGDFWFPMLIGLIELSCFPVLMVTRNWTFIGAWLGFKVLPHWKAWTEDRSTFNRFLIAQGLQLIFAALVLTKYIILLNK